ncbi:hypothetical protein NRB_38960 [Novosphingobium sp. 11B]
MRVRQTAFSTIVTVIASEAKRSNPRRCKAALDCFARNDAVKARYSPAATATQYVAPAAM